MRMPFGKFKGWEVEDIPEDYIQWLLSTIELPRQQQLYDQLLGELNRRHPPPPDPRQCSMMTEIVTAGYRALAKKYHTDHGGKHEDMVLLNSAVEQLREMLKAATV